MWPNAPIHRNGGRHEVRDAGRAEQLRKRLRRFLVNQSRQSQRLDLVEVTIGGSLDPQVDIPDMREQGHWERRSSPDAMAAAMTGEEPPLNGAGRAVAGPHLVSVSAALPTSTPGCGAR